jgi:1-acyl-sn-glycerol-3-phosphate acyltransferase
MLYRICWWIAFCLAKLLFRAKAFDPARIPVSGPVILASNHCSYADPVFIGTATRRRLHFLAKREAFGWFLVGPLIRRLNALPVARGTVDLRALSSVERTLRDGGAVLMFPQGTRRPDGGLDGAKPGIGFVATRTGAPVVPLYLDGTARIFRSLLGRGRVTVRFGAPVRAEEFQVPDNPRATYRRITDEVMKRMAFLAGKEPGEA